MERKISLFFTKWKKDLIRKPLVVYGPRQIGKTFTVLEFGKNEYKNVVYFNADNNKRLLDIFKQEKSPDKIIVNLSVLSGETILPNDTLIVFDNLNSIDIVKGIKLFGGGNNPYHIITITSRRENLNEFKGVELQFKSMYEMDFEEFLWARGEKQLAEIIRESFVKRRTCTFHQVALDLFYDYLRIGGLPEIVKAYLDGYSDSQIKALKQKTLDAYIKEIALSSNLIDIPRGIEVLSSVSFQLRKENKKFQYGLIGYGRRAKEYESSINYLVNNQIVARSYKIRNIKSPLSSCREEESFKLYMLDDGLLYSMLNVTKKEFETDENIRETLYENHIAKTLVESGYSLYYYQSQGKAEVNFVIQNRMGEIIPLEITTKLMSKAKSLSVLMKKFTVKEGYRITENNFSTKKDIRYLPVYAIFCLNDSKI